MRTEHYLHFENATDIRRSTSGLEATLGREKLRIDLIKDDVIRIKISRGGKFDERPSEAVAAEPELGLVSYDWIESAAGATITTSALRVQVAASPFSIDVHRTDGSVVFESARDGKGRPQSYSTLNDAFAIRRKVSAGDPIYGLGEKTGSFNRRGRDFTLWNTDVLNPTASGEFTADRDSNDLRADCTSTEFDPYYMSIPFFYHQDAASSKISGSFIDNPYRAFYDFTADNEILIHFSGGQYTEYVFGGPTMARILEQYTELTGRTALPPLWALGYHQCRWYGYVQDDIMRLADKHRELDVPLDTLWLDIDYMDGYRVFTWNDERYPDVRVMLDGLKKQGIRAITIIDPGVKHDPGYEVFDDGMAKDIFAKTEGGDLYIGQVWPGDTAFPDFSLPEGRAWWGALNAEHVKSGLAGIWNDMNEPATGEISPYEMRFGHGKYSHEQYHNQYALLMAMGTTEGLLEAMPNLRTFVLSRAGSAGIQRYAANWMGDNMSRFDHLWLSIPMGAGMSISGQSFVGADIGGFGEDSSPELFTRWIQYGALTPFARTHSMAGTVDQYVWAFGEDVLGHAREAIKLRYRLLPYIYSAFVESSETGAPIQRPLVFDYQDDAVARELDDQYLFGRDLLVAPIWAAGQTSRETYLPAGGWYEWHTGAAIESRGQNVGSQAPLDRIPIYAKAGAVVSMLPTAPLNTDAIDRSRLELHVFAPLADGTTTSFVQEDDGLTFDALTGKLVRTEFAVTRAGNAVTLKAVSTGAGFAGFDRVGYEIVWHTPAGERRESVASSTGTFEVSIDL
jgi:alpha-glucosidase